MVFTLQCAGGREVFYINTRIPLPAENDTKSGFLLKKDLHYLLRGGKSPAKNKDAIQTALRGNWRDAVEIWNLLPEDCIIKNNRGMALQVLNRHEEGMKDLIQAYFECPDKKEIRMNYEKSLSRTPAPVPGYRLPKKQITE